MTVLCGSLTPDQMETLPARKLVGPIRFCTLDCPDTVLADRLRRRPSWRGTSTEDAIARHQQFAAWLRAHIQPRYDTSQLTPAETAERIATWIGQSTDDAAVGLAPGNAPNQAQAPRPWRKYAPGPFGTLMAFLPVPEPGDGGAVGVPL